MGEKEIKDIVDKHCKQAGKDAPFAGERVEKACKEVADKILKDVREKHDITDKK